MKSENEKYGRGLANLASLANSTLEKAKQADTRHVDDIAEHLAERAAIQEFDGGLTREQAETEARRTLRVYEYRLTDNPDAWLVMIAPGCDLDEARGSLRARFGKRLIEAQEYKQQPQGGRKPVNLRD